jgi:hypothetical protein
VFEFVQAYKCFSLCRPKSDTDCVCRKVFESCKPTTVSICAGLQVFESVQVPKCLSLCKPRLLESVWGYKCLSCGGLQVFESVQAYKCLSLCRPISICVSLECWNLCGATSV